MTTTKEALEPYELAPCPFCGASAFISWDGDVNSPDDWSANCDNTLDCGASVGGMNSEAAAISAWNSRVSAPIAPVVDDDLIRRADAIYVAQTHNRTHSSGYRCYEGEVIAEKIAALPKTTPSVNVVATAREILNAILEAGGSIPCWNTEQGNEITGRVLTAISEIINPAAAPASTVAPQQSATHQHRWEARGEYGGTGTGYACQCGVDMSDEDIRDQISAAASPLPALPELRARSCDYRYHECSAQGVTVNGVWTCNKHIGASPAALRDEVSDARKVATEILEWLNFDTSLDAVSADIYGVQEIIERCFAAESEKEK